KPRAGNRVACECTEGGVFLVSDTTSTALEFLPGQGNQTRVEALPQQASGLVVTVLQTLDERSNLSGGRQWWAPGKRRIVWLPATSLSARRVTAFFEVARQPPRESRCCPAGCCACFTGAHHPVPA